MEMNRVKAFDTSPTDGTSSYKLAIHRPIANFEIGL